jgi:RNA polymerase sigma-70 factor, ECF subfamily
VDVTLPQPHPFTSADAERALVEAARGGDMDAVARLYERFAKPCMAVAFHILGDPHAAEDVVHDVFVGLPEALRRYQEHGKLEGWIRRVAARVALTRLRRERLAAETSIEDHPPFESVGADLHARMTLESAVHALPDSLRAVLVLNKVEGFSHMEIAQMLSISKGASEVRLHRALARLRTLLGPGDNP